MLSACTLYSPCLSHHLLFFFLLIPPPPTSTLFPYTTLFRSELDAQVTARVPVRFNRDDRYFTDTYQAMPAHGYTRMLDRKSTRLNSSHRCISYAVFCLKKKKKKTPS